MMSNYNEISLALSDKPFFTRSEIRDYIKTQKPMIKDSTFSWLLYDLCQKNIVQRVARDTYRVYDGSRLQAEYSAELSEDAINILLFLKKQFPLLTVAIWETRSFNEFAIHQIVRNFIFIEVEKPLDECVFNALREQSEHTVLYKPSEKEITMYSDEVTISVLPLTSEAPLRGFSPKLEKLLVDLFANKQLDRIVSRSDYPHIYEEAFSRYNVNYNIMLRYAKRRNKQGEIKRFICDNTSIPAIDRRTVNDKS